MVDVSIVLGRSTTLETMTILAVITSLSFSFYVSVFAGIGHFRRWPEARGGGDRYRRVGVSQPDRHDDDQAGLGSTPRPC